MFRPAVLMIAAILLLILALPIAASAKPAPPANLMKIFALFIEGEEYVEESRWDKLQSWLEDINNQHRQVQPELLKALSADERSELDLLEAAMADMRAAIDSKQHDSSHDCFLQMHKAFIALLDDFEYKMPPLMFLVANDIKEVIEAVEEKEMDEVTDELHEVELFYSKTVPALRNRKLPESMIVGFQTQLVQCKAALAKNDLKAFEVEIYKLQHLFSAQSRALSAR